jgi:hypothetical protein
MMLRRFALVFGATAALTLLVAWPVVRRPTERIYGTEISGRHPDPFAAMRRLDVSIADAFTQPATDWTGAAIARITGPVAAYNLVVLLSFPLAAAATDLLAFLLTGSSLASLCAGLLVMLGPYHLAHAAYHPHVAQIGWQALAFAAAVAFVHRPSMPRGAAAGASMLWLGAADFYGGFIGLVLAPVVAIARALTVRREARRRSAIAAALIALCCVASLAILSWWLRGNSGTPAFNDAQAVMFRARWWAYLLPAVDQPLWGAQSLKTIGDAGALPAIVELQLTAGITAMALAGCGLLAAVSGESERRRQAALVAFALVVSAVIASLAPVAYWLHRALPVFRSMARFGGAAGIGVSVLAGLGLAWICERFPARRTLIIVAAAAAVMVEYAPLPWRWRDVLPTAAHRWLVTFPPSTTVLDCSVPPGGDEAVRMAFGDRVREAGGAAFPECGDSDMIARAAADGLGFVIVPTGSELALSWTNRLPEGVRVMKRFPGASVYAITAAPPPLFVDRLAGCDARQWRNHESFCRVRQHLDLLVRNNGPRTAVVSVALSLQTESGDGAVVVSARGLPPQRLAIRGPFKPYLVGPITLPPGLMTVSVDAVNHEAFALGSWQWRPGGS